MTPLGARAHLARTEFARSMGWIDRGELKYRRRRPAARQRCPLMRLRGRPQRSARRPRHRVHSSRGRAVVVPAQRLRRPGVPQAERVGVKGIRTSI